MKMCKTIGNPMYGLTWWRPTPGAPCRRVGEPVVMHQRANEHALLAPRQKFSDLRQRELFASAQHDASLLGELNAVHLPLGPEFGLELRDSPEHVEEQPTRGVVSVDLLVEYLEMDALALEVVCNLAEVQRGAGQTVESGDHQDVALADILEADG